MFERKNRRAIPSIALMAATLFAAASASAQYVSRSVAAPDLRARILGAEEYVGAPLPPGFHIEMTELDGPVFADSKGRTLYRWPAKVMRNGITGDQQGTENQPGVSNCALAIARPVLRRIVGARHGASH